MNAAFLQQLSKQTDELRQQGLFKQERVITSHQRAEIRVQGGAASGQTVINLCANNYLGLSDSPDAIAAAKKGLDDHGFGMSSVRFICGTQDVHKELEGRLSRFLGTEDTILYSSCFDANGGLFETLLTEEDAIISDALNHASIIDGIRLCKAERHRYPNGDMAALEDRLKETRGKRLRLVATDGVFSMDGYLAKLAKQMASELLEEGVYVIGFSYPVVPKGEARIRVQLSAAHSSADIDAAVAAFRRVGKRLGIVS